MDMNEANEILKKMQATYISEDAQTNLQNEQVEKDIEVISNTSQDVSKEVENKIMSTIDSLPSVEKTSFTKNTSFDNMMEQVKQNTLLNASTDDADFVNKTKEALKSAVMKSAKVEENKADFENQKVTYASEKLNTAQQKNSYEAKENKWKNKEAKREYIYKGVKPLMTFVGIKEPMAIPLTIFLTLLIFPFYFFAILIRITFGTLLSGACDEDRPKSVKGFLWTLIAVIAILLITAIIYFFLKWQGLIY